MTYVQGFVAAVPTANKEEYRKHASDAAPLFEEFGVTRMVETWADDVPDGKVTDFKRSVQAKDDETVVFSWFEYPDKATYDAANKKMRDDPRMKEMGESMPFDGKRMIFGGFDSFVEEGTGGRGQYVDGFVLPVTPDKKQAYHDMASEAAANFKKYGATRVVEAWGDDVPDGEVTDFKRSVKAEGDEKVVFSFIEWPDKATRDAGWKTMMEDPAMQPDKDNMPFDGMRMFWGGFQPIVDTGAQTGAQTAEREPA